MWGGGLLCTNCARRTILQAWDAPRGCLDQPTRPSVRRQQKNKKTCTPGWAARRKLPEELNTPQRGHSRLALPFLWIRRLRTSERTHKVPMIGWMGGVVGWVMVDWLDDGYVARMEWTRTHTALPVPLWPKNIIPLSIALTTQ